LSGTDADDAFGEALWSAFAQRVEGLAELISADGAPTAAASRAAGVRYLTRFLAAGLRVCLECDDPDYPTFGRMIENAMSWGLDNPDCNYSWARVRGDASYRIGGTRGSARHLELQVNTGHMGDGNIPALGGGEDAWRTVSFLSGDSLETDAQGRFEILLDANRQEGNWLALDPEASHVLVRQYFDDWESERPAVLAIERIGAEYPRPALTPERLARHFDTLHTWLDAGLRGWDKVSRLLLSLEPNTLVVYEVTADVDRPGLHGQSYGMGPYACEPDEAVILEFPVPPCRMWSAALTNFWWESLDFGQRQTSLNPRGSGRRELARRGGQHARHAGGALPVRRDDPEAGLAAREAGAARRGAPGRNEARLVRRTLAADRPSQPRAPTPLWLLAARPGTRFRASGAASCW
jgi:hypothetical protein